MRLEGMIQKKKKKGGCDLKDTFQAPEYDNRALKDILKYTKAD